MTIREKLFFLELSGFANYNHQIDFSQIDFFISSMVGRLFDNFHKHEIQNCVRTDQNILIVTYLTHILEIGTAKAIAMNNFQNLPKIELENVACILGWAFNIGLGCKLVEYGLHDVPSLDGDFYIYFSGPTLELLTDRATHQISLARNQKILSLNDFIQLLVIKNL
ncbi:hypothetical protein ABIB40_001554 [Pedobacter sp. UYP30]|uniref:hypothetical protein n=1 Tax=Pedobacter sp. UYP30 TaxID=1756400 RepID=UPI0033965A99